MSLSLTGPYEQDQSRAQGVSACSRILPLLLGHCELLAVLNSLFPMCEMTEDTYLLGLPEAEMRPRARPLPIAPGVPQVHRGAHSCCPLLQHLTWVSSPVPTNTGHL